LLETWIVRELRAALSLQEAGGLQPRASPIGCARASRMPSCWAEPGLKGKTKVGTTMRLRDLLRYFAAPVLRPRAAMQALIEDHYRVVYALLIYLGLGVIYTFTVQMALVGRRPGI